MFGTANIDGETVGFIDVGTNSIHLLVVKFFKDSLGTTIFQDKETVRLGETLYRDGLISEETIAKAKTVVWNFTSVSKKMGADKVIARATCAARDAVNRKDLLDALEMDGLDLGVLPGYEEARLIRLGVFGPVAPSEKTLEIDIGGGSTEVILCRDEENLYMDSLNVGTLRFAYGSGIPNDTALSFSEYDTLRRDTDLVSYHTCKKVKEIGFTKAFGSSGTLMALAEMCAIKRGDGDSSYMMYYELVALMKDLYPLDVEERRKYPGMNAGRADIIVAGGAIAEELMYLLGIDRMEISQNGLKQGLQIDYLMKNGHSKFNVRESSVLTLASRCNYDKVHADFVRDMSLMFFDKSKEYGYHSMGDNMRELLSYAATLHDIGEFINYHKHHLHTYTIILNSNLTGFSMEELKMMALIARFHHKKFPYKNSRLFVDMSPKQIDNVMKCAMMLKIADVLDRRHDSYIKEVSVTEKDGTIVFDIVSDSDISMELWKLETVKEEFKRVFGAVPEFRKLSE